MAEDRIRPDAPYFSRFVVQRLGLTIEKKQVSRGTAANIVLILVEIEGE